MYELEEVALLNGLGIIDEGSDEPPPPVPLPMVDPGGALAAAAAAAAGQIVGQAIAGAATHVPGDPTGLGWPAAVPVRPSHWDLSVDPATYMVATGDTIAGLAATYLGSATRWLEIWQMQPPEERWNRSADEIVPGERLRMPEEAKQNFLKLKKGQPIPGDQPPPGVLPGEEKKKSKLPWLLAGGAAAAGAAYWLTR